MKHLICIFLLMKAFVPVSAQRVNTDAMVAFWRVVDRLKVDRTLDDSLWRSYYDLPGNRDYMEKNRYGGQVPEHRRYLEFVFRPSLSDSLRALEADTTKPGDDILDNLLYIKANEAQLRSYTEQVVSPGYLQQCIRLARQYLPENQVKPIPGNLTIYVMAMTFDAAVQDSSMYFGIARVYEYDKYRKGALAGHELHHQIRKDRGLVRRVSSADSAVFSAVDEINNEGCADLIDKMALLENPGKIFRGASTVHRLMDGADRTILQLDSCFGLNALGTASYVTDGQFQRILNYSSGHRPGLYMVDVIRRNGLEKRLIAHCDNPFAFFYLYNKAAAQDPAKPPVFSAGTLGYLRELERRGID
jgi:hypothetical protein